MTDYERGRRFLAAIEAIEGDDLDRAGEACFAVLEMGLAPEDVDKELVESVGRAIVEAAAWP